MSTPTGASRSLRWRVAALALVPLLLVLAFWLGHDSLSVWWRERALPRGRTPSILLLTLDSVRADHVGCYGRQPSETPNLDAACAAGVVFEQAYTSAPLCVPAHASLLTGCLPVHHGIRDDHGSALRPDVPTLAAEFQKAGYRTAAFVASTSLDRRTGLDRGFDTYHDDLGAAGKAPGRDERAAASEVVYRAMTWLDEVGSGPLFLWVHLADALAPFTPPEPPPPDFRERPYEAEIAALDTQISRLLEAVRRARPGALVTIVADHGTALGEHGEAHHGYYLYGGTTHVPFLIVGPGLPAGRRLRPVVRTVDLMPTLLDIVGLAAPPGVDGSTLVPLLVGRASEGPGPAPMETLGPHLKYGMSPLFALRAGPYLYVRAPRPELYDVQQDPGEQDNAVGRLPRVAETLDRDLQRLVPEAGKDVRAARDPKDSIELFDRYQAAQELESKGKGGAAVVVYRSILSESPDFVFARRKLAESLVAQGRWQEARLALQELVERGEANEATYLNIALVHYRMRMTKEAVDWLRRGVAALPRSAALHHRLGRVLLETGAPKEAARELAESMALEPRLVDAHLALGDALLALGREDEARQAYERCVEIAPVSSEAKEARAALERLGAAR